MSAPHPISAHWKEGAPLASPGGDTLDAESEGAADPDADGHDNSDEYVAGTVPTNVNSVLRITSFACTDMDGSVLTFQTVSNRQYSVEYNTNSLATNAWHDLTNGIQGTSVPFVITNRNHTAALYFYRIRTTGP